MHFLGCSNGEKMMDGEEGRSSLVFMDRIGRFLVIFPWLGASGQVPTLSVWYSYEYLTVISTIFLIKVEES